MHPRFKTKIFLSPQLDEVARSYLRDNLSLNDYSFVTDNYEIGVGSDQDAKVESFDFIYSYDPLAAFSISSESNLDPLISQIKQAHSKKLRFKHQYILQLKDTPNLSRSAQIKFPASFNEFIDLAQSYKIELLDMFTETGRQIALLDENKVLAYDKSVDRVCLEHFTYCYFFLQDSFKHNSTRDRKVSLYGQTLFNDTTEALVPVEKVDLDHVEISIPRKKSSGSSNNQDLSVISSSLAHEINNSIGGVSAAIDFLQMSYSFDELDEIKQRLAHCAETVNLFLSFAKKNMLNSLGTCSGAFLKAQTLLKTRTLESQTETNLSFKQASTFEKKLDENFLAFVFYIIIGDALEKDKTKQIALSLQEIKYVEVCEHTQRIDFNISQKNLKKSMLLNHLLELLNLQVKSDEDCIMIISAQ